MQYHYRIHIEGLVQGVGFRPFVYRLAREMALRGVVDNRNDGVHIGLLGTPDEERRFVRRLLEQKPPIARIERIRVRRSGDKTDYSGFTIAPSRSCSAEITRISPDIAVCDACLEDIRRQPHRIDYPFVNCTRCGPRFSIVQALPYDRISTTMSVFPLCAACAAEYDDPNDRRFHAQPVACNRCGPVYTLFAGGRNRKLPYRELLVRVADCLRSGGVVALKGIGGYNLLARADDALAVLRVRAVKQRDGKPFAVLFASEKHAAEYVTMTPEERALLASWRRPIVLLPMYRRLAAGVNDRLNRLGVVLPSMPVHYQLFELLGDLPLLFTSGNRCGEPIAIEHDAAVAAFGDAADLVVSHDRGICNRIDDSVTQWNAGGVQLLRRARGYAPEPISVPAFSCDSILAFGAEQAAVFAVGKEYRIIQSQHIGDLKNRETFVFYEEALDRFRSMFRFSPAWLACDLHPDYATTRLAERTAEMLSLPLIRVQHHHAHAAAVMAEYNIAGPVLAVVLDGTGYGADGKNWGGEFLLCEGADYRRLSHFPYVPQPGGDRAAREPWRMAVSYLHTLLGASAAELRSIETRIGREPVALLGRMLERSVNCPLTSSAGRLFDAVASLLGVCDENGYQAEASMRLEQAADPGCRERYAFDPEHPLDFTDLFRCLGTESEAGVPVSLLSARFHRTLAARIVAESVRLLRQQRTAGVVLCGGVFQNRLLAEAVSADLRDRNIRVWMPEQSSCNDGGIAVGQLYVAAARRKREEASCTN